MMANREGLFHAYPVEIGLGETKEKKLLQAVIRYRLFESEVEGEWVDCSGEGLEITGYHILEKRDHTLNTTTIDALKAALGWDGCDPFWLQDNADALYQQPVQLRLAFEEYNGSTSLKVQFLNPYGSRIGGVPRADEEMRRSIANRLGPKFRAVAGGTPANPPKPAGKPAPSKVANPAPTPAAPPSPVAAAPAPAPAPRQDSGQAPSASSGQAPRQDSGQATMEQAWAEFTKNCPPPKWDQAAIEAEWFRILADLFPGKQAGELTPTEWGIMLAEGPGKIIPF